MCDLIICDEGHRLKNLQIQTSRSLNELKCKRRILLSGTPLQNSMCEFYSCISFVNPGILGSLQAFNRLYAEPIVRGQEPSATEEDREIGWARAQELSKITAQFILRRTGSLLESLLPPRYEYLLFFKLSKIQMEIYKGILGSHFTRNTIESGTTGNILSILMFLRKILNHPDLLFYKQPSSCDTLSTWKQIISYFPNNYSSLVDRMSVSYKMLFLERLLAKAITLGDKIVVVSNFTQTLNIIQALCDSHNIITLRLDGKTQAKRRQQIVNQFNSPTDSSMVFLLSTKAGGVGLNLIGANRLVLFDADWNPSNDKQSMGRIWREGQQKPVFIYRLFTAGTIEEKIYQRQTAKDDLFQCLIDSKNKVKKFSREYLEEIFSIYEKCMSFKESSLLTSEQHLIEETGEGILELVRVNLAEWNSIQNEDVDFSGAVMGGDKRKAEEEEGTKRGVSSQSQENHL